MFLGSSLPLSTMGWEQQHCLQLNPLLSTHGSAWPSFLIADILKPLVMGERIEGGEWLVEPGRQEMVAAGRVGVIIFDCNRLQISSNRNRHFQIQGVISFQTLWFVRKAKDNNKTDLPIVEIWGRDSSLAVVYWTQPLPIDGLQCALCWLCRRCVLWWHCKLGGLIPLLDTFLHITEHKYFILL